VPGTFYILNPEYRDIVIPNADDEEFQVVAEVVGKCVGLV
jgi:hypothetical protein